MWQYDKGELVEARSEAHLTMRASWPLSSGARTMESEMTSVFSPSSGYGTVRSALAATSRDSCAGGSISSPSKGSTSCNLRGEMTQGFRDRGPSGITGLSYTDKLSCKAGLQRQAWRKIWGTSRKIYHCNSLGNASKVGMGIFLCSEARYPSYCKFYGTDFGKKNVSPSFLEVSRHGLYPGQKAHLPLGAWK